MATNCGVPSVSPSAQVGVLPEEGTFHTRLLAKEPQGYFVFPSHHQSPCRARVFLAHRERPWTAFTPRVTCTDSCISRIGCPQSAPCRSTSVRPTASLRPQDPVCRSPR